MYFTPIFKTKEGIATAVHIPTCVNHRETDRGIYSFMGVGGWSQHICFAIEVKSDKMLKREKKTLYIHSPFLQFYALVPNGYHLNARLQSQNTHNFMY